MEWVETTGTSVEEAKELALDQLGVDSGDAEFEVLEEPKVGLFGRTRGSARVRARVSPKAPRPKTERRRRSKKSDGGRSEGSRNEGAAGGNAPSGADRGASSSGADDKDGSKGKGGRKPSSGQNKDGGRRGGERAEKPRQDREPMDVAEQQQVLVEFLEGLGASFGLDVSAEASAEGEEVRVNLTGDGLGVLVGPRMATLDAVQEIARNALQRQADGREYARVVVDVQGIRLRRRDALTEFVADAARQVVDDDVTVVFEVMSSADRKVVHDVTSSLDGVESASEGEDPRRRVVLRKA